MSKASRWLAPALLSLALAGAAACDDNNGPALLPIPGVEPTHLHATLTGSGVRPTAVMTQGSGAASLTLSGDRLSFTVTATELSSPANGAHIHAGGVNEVGPIVFPFNFAAVQSGTIASGAVDLRNAVLPSGISGDSLRALLLSGNAYIDVHTVNFPNGEIRGSVVRQ